MSTPPNTQQIPVSFDKDGFNAEAPRKRVKRSGWEERYKDVLEYLRIELSNGGWSKLDQVEIGRTFNVSQSLLGLCVKYGALERIGKKRQYSYKATPKLATLTAQQIRDYRLDEFPNPPYVVPEHLKNKTPEQVRAFADAMNSMNVPTGLLTADPRPAVSAPSFEPEPVFLVGVVASDGTLEAATADQLRYSDIGIARDAVMNFPASVGTKLAIVQVIEVYESAVTVTMKPTNAL